MKFKKSISIILSATMVANFTCAQLVSAQGSGINTENEVVSVKGTTEEKEISTALTSVESQSGNIENQPSPDKKETKKSLQENYKDLPNTTKKETSPTGIEPMLSG